MSVDHYENFPVASVLCPPRLRPAVQAIYHYARTADDIADEGTATAAERLAALAVFRTDLQEVVAGRPPSDRWPEVFLPLSLCLQEFALPTSLLHDLLDAFEQDVRNPHYADRGALLDYCRRSANPIGRLLLHLYGIDDARSLADSDAICTALQLINFWQDLSVDGPRGRCYIPETDRQRHGVAALDLRSAQDSPRARQLVQALCTWSEELMRSGSSLATRLPGRTGWELRLVVQGGLRILDKLRRMDHAALAQRPRIGAADLPVLLWRATRMRP